MVRRAFVIIWIAVLLGALVVVAFDAFGQEFPGGPPKRLEKLKEKTGCANLETCLKRAGERAKEDARARTTSLLRITATPSDAKEFQAFLVVCEFKDGSVSLFQGGSESVSDQYVIVEKDQVLMVGESCARTK